MLQMCRLYASVIVPISCVGALVVNETSVEVTRATKVCPVDGFLLDTQGERSPSPHHQHTHPR